MNIKSWQHSQVENQQVADRPCREVPGFDLGSKMWLSLSDAIMRFVIEILHFIMTRQLPQHRGSLQNSNEIKVHHIYMEMSLARPVTISQIYFE